MFDSVIILLWGTYESTGELFGVRQGLTGSYDDAVDDVLLAPHRRIRFRFRFHHHDVVTDCAADHGAGGAATATVVRQKRAARVVPKRRAGRDDRAWRRR